MMHFYCLCVQLIIEKKKYNKFLQLYEVEEPCNANEKEGYGFDQLLQLNLTA